MAIQRAMRLLSCATAIKRVSRFHRLAIPHALI